jgi:hypothetical protein
MNTRGQNHIFHLSAKGWEVALPTNHQRRLKGPTVRAPQGLRGERLDQAWVTGGRSDSFIQGRDRS